MNKLNSMLLLSFLRTHSRRCSPTFIPPSVDRVALEKVACTRDYANSGPNITRRPSTPPPPFLSRGASNAGVGISVATADVIPDLFYWYQLCPNSSALY